MPPLHKAWEGSFLNTETYEDQPWHEVSPQSRSAHETKVLEERLAKEKAASWGAMEAQAPIWGGDS